MKDELVQDIASLLDLTLLADYDTEIRDGVVYVTILDDMGGLVVGEFCVTVEEL